MPASRRFFLSPATIFAITALSIVALVGSAYASSPSPKMQRYLDKVKAATKPL